MQSGRRRFGIVGSNMSGSDIANDHRLTVSDWLNGLIGTSPKFHQKSKSPGKSALWELIWRSE